MKTYNQFMEGTWALPGNDKKQKELIALFKKPIPAKTANDKIYNLIGSDSLGDLIDQVSREDGPTTDVRSSIKGWLESNTKLLKINGINPAFIKKLGE